MTPMRPIPKGALTEDGLSVIIEGLRDTLLDSLASILKDEADLVPFATEIASKAAEAAAVGDDEKLRRLLDLLPYLVAYHEIKAAKAFMATLQSVIQFSTQLINTVLAGALASIGTGGLFGGGKS